MMIYRALATAVVTLLAVGPAFSADGVTARHDKAYAGSLADAQIRCYDLMVQFDNSVSGMKKTKEVQSAKALRIRGARQCGAEEDLNVVKKGEKTLEQALKDIGQKPQS